MRLPVSTFTTEVIGMHEKDMKHIESEIARLEKMDARTMWLADLEHV